MGAPQTVFRAQSCPGANLPLRAGRAPRRRLLLPALGLLLLAGCAAGPDYHRPGIDVPTAWTVEEPWRVARPDDHAERGPWWESFGDTQLNALEAAATASNPGLAIASEHLVQARALVTVNSAALFPQLGATLGAERNKISADRPRASYGSVNSSTVQNDLTAGFTVRYEADLFGGNRRRAEAARASAEQAQADLANARLVLTAEVAADYFSLRALDAEIDVVRQNIAAQRRALDFVSARHDNGVASGLDLAQQQALLDTTVTQIDLLQVQRAKFEHALARLTGTSAAGFAITPQVVPLRAPSIPLGVPAELLQRRPDVAGAERAMAAANAQIGVARAAYFPAVMLNGGYGRESSVASTLFSAPATLWSLGASATQTLFDAGRLGAGTDIARSAYQASVAGYRDSVLLALQEVEDGLTGSANLARAASQAQAAVSSAQRVVDLANDRYTGGLANYLDVITAQQGLLANQRLQVQVNGQQMLVAVYLVKALGGDWTSGDVSGSGAAAPSRATPALSPQTPAPATP